MKKKLLIAMWALGTLFGSSSVFGQGYFNFNNLGAYDGTVNSHLPFIFGTGVIIGSGSVPDYSIGFLWNTDTTLTSASGFRNASGTHVGGVTASFFAPTGDVADGAGIFDGGTSGSLAGTSDGQNILVQIVAWQSGAGGDATYDQSITHSFNNGFSALMTVRLAAGADPNVADLSSMVGFPILIPEPSISALAGMGAVVLFAIRRRKETRKSCP